MGSSSKRARRRQNAHESLEREASHSKQVKRQQPDSDTEEEGDREVLFPPRKREIVVTPPSPSRVLEVPDCGITSVTSMVKTLNDAIAAMSHDTAQIQRAYQQLRRDNLARDKAMADLTAMVKEYGSSPAATRPYGSPTPKMQTDVLDEDGNLCAADIGITWADNETFLHSVRVVGTKFPRPTGHEPVMSTPYPEGRNDDRGPSPMTSRPSSPETAQRPSLSLVRQLTIFTARQWRLARDIVRQHQSSDLTTSRLTGRRGSVTSAPSLMSTDGRRNRGHYNWCRT